ncbi:MAG TPA: acylphosphatase [Deltaproteobacteria bacterium]|nr:acylphosphatase [Deltaproteobacteria bacterium]
MTRAEVIIRGHVQGVGYRAWTQRTAQALSLQGWVRNLEDRTVQAVFVGPRATIEEMLQRCHDGPRLAQVEGIEISWRPGDEPSGFEIRPTARAGPHRSG